IEPGGYEHHSVVLDAILADPLFRLEVAFETAKKAETAAMKAVAPKESVYVQFAGVEADVKALADAAKADFKANNKNAKVTDLKLYVKPEERTAYYVVNEKFEGKVNY
ncbi:MAG: hypothetical protein IIT41_05440, partial [Oscillospiraceae bacterium]|nr:hypothetical protein [Oscillospiraceae bacterium]